jgi:hypothetical protein
MRVAGDLDRSPATVVVPADDSTKGSALTPTNRLGVVGRSSFLPGLQSATGSWSETAGKLFADVVAWLSGDEVRWITGQNIRANGGLI